MSVFTNQRIEALVDQIHRMLMVEGDGVVHGLVVAELTALWILAVDPNPEQERSLALHVDAVRRLLAEIDALP